MSEDIFRFWAGVRPGDKAKKADVSRAKQALRDVTDDPEIEAATTPEALKAVWPRP
jgi:hypothetical protein